MKFFIKHWKLLPSAWLLATQFLILIIGFFPIEDPTYRILMWTLGVLTLLFIARVIRETFVFKIIGWSFILGAIGCLILLLLGFYSTNLQIISHIFEIGSYLCAAYGLLRYMFADQYLTKDELFAGAAVFTLLAWAFAYAYNICQLVNPNSFSNANGGSEIQSWLDILFYSFSLQSATGLSNLLPSGVAVKVLSILQMFIGVMYLGIIVSRLIKLQYVTKLPQDKNK